MAKIQLNGRKLELNSRYSISTLLKKYKINGKKIAVELNGKIISRTKYNSIYLKSKDKIEIVHFIGGG
jgi:sulfur carrier protein